MPPSRSPQAHGPCFRPDTTFTGCWSLQTDFTLMRILVPFLLTAVFATVPAGAQHTSHGSIGARPPRPATLPAQTVYEPQASAGAVAFVVSPRWSDGKLVVLLAVDADSVDLAQIDLGKALRLIVNEQVIVPTAADSLSGHYARARVVFPLATAPAHFRIEIRGVPDVDARVLHWALSRQ